MMRVISEFVFKDILIRYLSDESENAGIMLLPVSMKDKINENKKYAIDSLIQAKIEGDDYPSGFSHGHSMRNSQSTSKLKFYYQELEEELEFIRIITILKNKEGHISEHILTWFKNSEALEVKTIYKNHGSKEICLEMLSSFSIGSITPFEEGESPNNLLLHRLRSKWSSEGRIETRSVEELQLEPSWSRYGVSSERYGQVGSMPVRKYFPFAAVEDIKNGVIWGVQVCCASTWQIELYRRDDALCISGGIGDLEFGHWRKKLKPGEEFTTPKAYISVSKGGIDEISHRLASMQKKVLYNRNNKENELPIVFNEFCTTWGKPSHENIIKIIEKIKGKGIKYFIIDAGWYAEKDKGWDSTMGDWNRSSELFPEGLEKTVSSIKSAGMIPGIWFEFEVCARNSMAFNMTEHLLKRDGNVITTGNRRFWDMRDPWVVSYLSEKVIDFLKKYEFGYIKVDYNDNLGIGCDGAESYGEGLRQTIEASQNFFLKIREEIPEIVIENCSSGGHRLEPSMMELCDMASFSDAHECLEIPIIAANVMRSILPRQSQIWAVLRKNDTDKRIVYSIANTFLGRMCLSGDIFELNNHQWDTIEAGVNFYKKLTPVIRDGKSFRFGPDILNYRFPEGWQAVFRVSDDNRRAIFIFHTFGGQQPHRIQIKIPEGLRFDIKDIFSDINIDAELEEDVFSCSITEEFTAAVIYMELRKAAF